LEPLYECAATAKVEAGEDSGLGPSGRTRLRVLPDRLAWGSQEVFYAELAQATISFGWFPLPGYRLRLFSPRGSVLFRLGPSAFWSQALPFPVRRRPALASRPASLVLRLALVALFAYFFWVDCSGLRLT